MPGEGGRVLSGWGVMYVTEAVIRQVEESYGKPREVSFSFTMYPGEFKLLLSSMKDSRAHDITLFILRGEGVAVIRKPSHRPGVYRAPSGGLRPGEDFEAGALREAREETGLAVALERYIVRSCVTFSHEGHRVPWVTHVFTARPLGGALSPQDKKEIADVRFVTLRELATTIRDALLTSRSGGLHYRAALTDVVLEELQSRGD